MLKRRWRDGFNWQPCISPTSWGMSLMIDFLPKWHSNTYMCNIIHPRIILEWILFNFYWIELPLPTPYSVSVKFGLYHLGSFHPHHGLVLDISKSTVWKRGEVIGLFRNGCVGLRKIFQMSWVEAGTRTQNEADLPGKFQPTTPWKINMEPTNHQFRQENDLPNLHDYVPC